MVTFKIATAEDLANAIENATPEQKTAWRREEFRFRKGYYYGATHVLEALEKGCTVAQIWAWSGVVFKWCYNPYPGDGYEKLETPPLPEPWPPEDWRRLRQEVLERDHHACAYCGDEADAVDHIIPVSRGGPHVQENLVAVCKPCNSSKGNKLLEEWTGPPLKGL